MAIVDPAIAAITAGALSAISAILVSLRTAINNRTIGIRVNIAPPIIINLTIADCMGSGKDLNLACNHLIAFTTHSIIGLTCFAIVLPNNINAILNFANDPANIGLVITARTSIPSKAAPVIPAAIAIVFIDPVIRPISVFKFFDSKPACFILPIILPIPDKIAPAANLPVTAMEPTVTTIF